MKGYVKKSTHDKLCREHKVVVAERDKQAGLAHTRLGLMEGQQEANKLLKTQKEYGEREHGWEIERRERAENELWETNQELGKLRETIIEMAKKLHAPGPDEE